MATRQRLNPECRLEPGWDEHDVRRWLLAWFGGEPSELPGLPPRVDPPVVVQALFDGEPADRREVLKRGVALALLEWREVPDGLETLADLARTAALLRVSATIGVLGGIVEREFDRAWVDARSRALSACVAALHGFAPSRETERALQRLFYHPQCDPHLAAQLYAGLSRCTPEDYPIHAGRFFELRERVRSRFMHAGFGLLRAIGPPVFVERFAQLAPAHQQAFVELIRPIKDSPVEITVATRGLRLVATQQPNRQAFAELSVAEPAKAYADQYQSVLAGALVFDPKAGAGAFDPNAALRRLTEQRH